jgi:hypothetical protein
MKLLGELDFMMRQGLYLRSAHAAALAVALGFTGAGIASDGPGEACVEPGSLPAAPSVVNITQDASENVEALRQSLAQWQGYRLALVSHLKAECAKQMRALTASSDCEIGPLEGAWDDQQLTGGAAENSIQLAVALRYVMLSATDIRGRFVSCRTSSQSGT